MAPYTEHLLTLPASRTYKLLQINTIDQSHPTRKCRRGRGENAISFALTIRILTGDMDSGSLDDGA